MQPVTEYMRGQQLVFQYLQRRSVPVQPTKVAVLLHGYGGTPSHLLPLAETLPPTWQVVLPEGPIRAGTGAGWWRFGLDSAGQPAIDAEQAEKSRLLLIQFLGQLHTLYRIAYPDMVLAGFSQGGTLALQVAQSKPDRMGALGVLSGRLLTPDERRFAPLANLRQLPIYWAHGTADEVLPYACAEAGWQTLRACQAQLSAVAVPGGGHNLLLAQWPQLRFWLETVPKP